MSEQATPDRCRRCCEAGADHEWRTDENGGFDFVYLCYGCSFYGQRHYGTAASAGLARRLLNRIGVILNDLRRFKTSGGHRLEGPGAAS